MNCPCCPTGEITEYNICDTCGVGIAKGSEAPAPRPAFGRVWRKRQDQDERYDNDYTRTKEDKR